MNLFQGTFYVTMGLSNMCNFSYAHKKCPASIIKAKEVLPSETVYNILDTLGKYKYGKGKTISFHLYNEPLNDPRLFKFIEYASFKCPHANINIGTNGWYLTENLAKELYASGATYILVSSYSNNEHNRLYQIKKILLYY